jgi:TorA maturation chaperone TorD
MTVSAAQQALARSRAYDLFGRLYRQGLTAAVVPAVRAVPGLTDAVPDPFDADAAAADHYDLFGLNVFPYASFFLDASGRLGGPVTDLVRHQLQRVDLAPQGDAESADHLGHELAYLALLVGAEADAYADGARAEVQRMQHLQRQFLDGHLLWWLPPFARAVRQQKHPFYARLANLTWELVVDHRAALGGAAAGPLTPEPDDPPAGLLDDEATGLKDIAAFLTMPVWSGLVLRRDDITQLGRSERLPRGFGDRTQMLTNLLRSAVEYDGLDPVLGRLAQQAGAWRAYYQSLDTDVVPLNDIAVFWQARLDATDAVIGRIRTAASASTGEAMS